MFNVNPLIVIKKVNDNYRFFNKKTETFVELDQIGSEIFQEILNGVNETDKIVLSMCKKYQSSSNEEILVSVKEFIDTLLTQGILI